MSLQSSGVSSQQPSTIYYQQQPQPYGYSTPPQPVQTEPVEQIVNEESHEKSVKKEKSKKEIKYVFQNTPPKTEKEKKEFLQQYHFYILIDSSASMGFELSDDESSDNDDDEDAVKTTSWKITQEYLKSIVSESVKDDKQGVSVCFFNSKTEVHDKVESHEQVEEMFEKHKPKGGTALDLALHWALHKHFEKKGKSHNDKHTIILVITDGKPDNPTEAENQIIYHANKIHAEHIFTYNGCKKSHELGIRFFQVGKDTKAKAYLNKLAHSLKKDGAKVEVASTGNIDELHSSKDVRDALISAIYG